MDVICHRACPASGPENSLEAASAIPDWVDMIEVDVQRCSTGELVVFHDRVLDRVTAGSGAIAGTPWDRLREMTLEGTEATIPRLQPLIDAIPTDIGLNVELKHAGIASDLISILDGLEHEILVSSFVPQAIVPLAEAGIRTAHLIEPDRSSEWESELAVAESIGAAAIHPHYDTVDADRVGMAHNRGFKVNAWTVPDEKTVKRLRAAGVDGVVVDDWQIVERDRTP